MPVVAAVLQAMLALREMVLGRWAALGRPRQQATLHFLLQLALAQASQPGPLMRAQVHATAASIIKRGWLENAGEEQAAALHAIHAQSTQPGTAEARRAGLELLTAVVEEFSPVTASVMGLSWCVVSSRVPAAPATANAGECWRTSSCLEHDPDFTISPLHSFVLNQL